jgi:hypothetical protein
MGLSIYEHRSMRVHFKIQKEAADLGAVWLAASTRHSTVFRATPLFCHATVNDRRGCDVWRTFPPATVCGELVRGVAGCGQEPNNPLD